MKIKTFYLLGFAVVLGLCSLSGSKSYGQESECQESCGKDDAKVMICHQPTANLNNNENAKGPEELPSPKTLCVSEEAAQKHIENHGDTCGECDEVE